MNVLCMGVISSFGSLIALTKYYISYKCLTFPSYTKNYANGAAQHANNLILRLLFNIFFFISTQNQTNFLLSLTLIQLRKRFLIIYGILIDVFASRCFFVCAFSIIMIYSKYLRSRKISHLIFHPLN